MKPQSLVSNATVYVVDDDPGVRDAISSLVETVGINVESFESAESFLRYFNKDKIGCLVLDIRMSDMDGLELQDYMQAHRITLPVIIISGHGDIPMAVQTLKKGAIDFIEKPFRNQTLLDCIKSAIKISYKDHTQKLSKNKISENYDDLSTREKQVARLVADGLSSKEIAKALNLSSRTVETHRSNILHKLGVKSTAEIIRFIAEID